MFKPARQNAAGGELFTANVVQGLIGQIMLKKDSNTIKENNMNKLHTIAQHAVSVLVVATLCLSLASGALHAQDAQQAPVEEQAVVSDEQAALAGAIAEANNAFAWSLYAKVTEGESG
ncbi:MAG: hypothetical protein KAU28_05900, partial [Phycisphaerae bacterium]|nr:hypothetical protein [Phycisphaerae bacterium]